MGTTGCQSDPTLDHLSKTLKVPMNSGSIVTFSDTHGGFHGDGKTLIEVHFADDICLKGIKKSAEWNPFPLTDNLTALVYGLKQEDSQIGPMLSDEQLEPLIPEVTNGYYFFMDRHSESTDKKDDSAVLERSSFNFTIVLYDTDTDTLYYMELDT